MTARRERRSIDNGKNPEEHSKSSDTRAVETPAAEDHAIGSTSKDLELRYGEAMTELESILNAIENDDVDLDDLGSKVERASALIQICQEKIARTEMQVRKVIDTIESDREGT